MTFRVHLQYPKPKDMGLCCISLDKHGQALLITSDGAKVIMEMQRAMVDWMGANGIMVSGMEINERNGRPKFRYQEWYCGYVEG